MSKAQNLSGWAWCKHPPECHQYNTAASRRDPDLKTVPLFRTASSGWNTHSQTHHCPPTCNIDRLNLPTHDLPTNIQFIRYAGALYRSSYGDSSKDNILRKYRTAWAKEYPDRDPPLDVGGGPAFLHDLPEPFEWPSIHPHAPSPGPSLSNPSNPLRPAAPSVAPVAPVVGPSFSKRSNEQPPPQSPFSSARSPGFSGGHSPGPPLSPHSPESLSHSGASEALLSHLRKCTVEVDLIPKFSQVRDGLIPRFDHNLVPPHPQRVVFVELPEHRFTRSSPTQGTHLATVQVDVKSYKLLKSTVPFSVRRIPTPEGQQLPNGELMVVVPAMFVIALDMLEMPDCWDVTFIAWELYRDTVVQGGQNGQSGAKLWKKLLVGTDLIIGGLDFEGDYLNTSVNPWNLSLEDTIRYKKSMCFLSSKTSVWVRIMDLYLGGLKQETAYMLQACAKALGYAHPITLHIDRAELCEELKTKDFCGVLKRGHSSLSQHVITPNTVNQEAVLKSALGDEEKYWSPDAPNQLIMRPAWFLQPYHHLLLYLGENRSVIVNGVLYYTASTVTREPSDPSDIQIGMANLMRPLNSFRYDPDNLDSPTKIGWLTIENGDDFNPLDLVKNSYTEYVLKMLGMLVEAEEFQYKRFSGLRIFVRMDVSVYRHIASGQYQYFVNEVTRSNSTHLFHQDARIDGDHMVNQLTKALLHCSFHKLLQE